MEGSPGTVPRRPLPCVSGETGRGTPTSPSEGLLGALRGLRMDAGSPVRSKAIENPPNALPRVAMYCVFIGIDDDLVFTDRTVDDEYL